MAALYVANKVSVIPIFKNCIHVYVFIKAAHLRQLCMRMMILKAINSTHQKLLSQENYQKNYCKQWKKCL